MRIFVWPDRFFEMTPLSASVLLLIPLSVNALRLKQTVCNSSSVVLSFYIQLNESGTWRQNIKRCGALRVFIVHSHRQRRRRRPNIYLNDKTNQSHETFRTQVFLQLVIKDAVSFIIYLTQLFRFNTVLTTVKKSPNILPQNRSTIFPDALPSFFRSIHFTSSCFLHSLNINNHDNGELWKVAMIIFTK